MAAKRPASPTHEEYLLGDPPFLKKGPLKLQKGGPFDPHWPISRMNSAKGAFLWDELDQDQWSEITRAMLHQMSWWIHCGQGSINSLFWYNIIQVILEHWSWSWSSQRNAPRYLGKWKRLDVELQVVIKNPRQAKYTSFKIANLPLVLRLADKGSITSKKYLSSVSLTLSFNTGRSQLRGKLHAPPLQINSNTLSPIILIEYSQTPSIRTLSRP